MAVTNNLIGYALPAQVACTIGSLAAGSARESAIVTNTANKYFDYLVALTFTIITGGPSSTTAQTVNIYANATNDGTLWPIIQKSDGTTFQSGGGDAAVGALSSPPNLRLIGSMGLQSTTSSTERTFRTEPCSVASAFNGVLPPAFSIIIENQLGIALSSSTVTTANYLQVEGIYSSSGN